MIDRLIAYCLRQPLMVMLALLLFIGAGIAAFRVLPVEAFPDVSDTQVTVVSLHPGRAAEEVEREVTMPLEVALSGIPHSVRVFSHTQFGLSMIILTFDDKADDYFARQQVLERLQGVELPEGVTPELEAMSSAVGEIYRYVLKGPHLTSTQLRTTQEWVMERGLRTVPGVANVVSFGGFARTFQVKPDLDKLRDRGISLGEFAEALEKGSSNAGGGYVERGQQQFLIRGVGLMRTPADIGNVVVAQRGGTPVLVRDLAGIADTGLPRQGLVGQDDNDDAVFGMVLMRKGENPSDVLDALHKRIAEIEANQLPAGVSIEPFYDRSWLVSTTLKTVFRNLLEGAVLVFLVLWLFLYNARAALIVAAMMPLALLSTFLGLHLWGVPANLLSLGAMDFGIIIDGAVIVTEHIVSRLSKLPPDADRKTRFSTILSAVSEVGRPTFFSMLIIIAAHIPIFTLQRQEGRMFAPMAYSVTSALIGALILALTVVPLFCFWWLRRDRMRDGNPLMDRLAGWYKPVLERALARPRAVVLTAVALLVATLALGTRLGSEFLPELDEGSIWLTATLDPSTSLAEAQQQSRRIRELVGTFPQVSTVVAKLGRPEDGSDAKGANQIEALVALKPEKEWPKGVDKRQLVSDLQRTLEQRIPGPEFSISQPVRDNILESISQIKGQVVIKVSGSDLEVLNRQAQAILAQVRGVEGVESAFIDRDGSLPQLQIEIDRDRAARYGLNVRDVDEVIETALGGRQVGELWEGDRRFPITLRLDDADRDLQRLRTVPVGIGDGHAVTLSDVADFRMASGAINISRENAQRVKAVSIFIAGRDMGSVVADMRKRVDANVPLAEGYRLEWSGEFENQQRAMKRLGWVIPLSVLLIFVLLFDAFKDISSAALILANVPLAMIGGILALWLTGIPLSVSAAIGFIALFGQAVLNGVVMLSRFAQLREQGMDLLQSVVQGSLQRLRTVLMTALLAMFGLLPMATSHAIGAETQKPLAVVVIGGLLSAMLLTLLVLPTLYYWVHRRREARAG
ncbi:MULTISPECIES: CusA/CzcA family heavy metal efflux RND transporter [unclassified Stenotrophomonas]|uniref:efflux RND transporter permease subunit n=1 Tax=unclassified Stenotrophomonas TaxID=196198 RepID=UPI000D1743A2|nr:MULTISPECIES: CusA/CzcA family heavy metal efflux RND transporter [unclassified Stenotrophomonas]PTA72896.1 CusA/CzcA family heavy metal efflux RND transporter [Stenotrophomonas sp. Nf1]PTA82278.1 CusA/CzcA family heavy metal efflux RND transporter [Stenotrophomonas sp. Nf4]